MKNKIAGIIGLIAVIFLFTSGLFEWCTNVFVWLITLNYSSPTISVFGQLFVKYSTWIVTFTSVGIIFKSLNLFNSDAMKLVYFVVSTLISFALSYVVMILEQYAVYIAIGLAVVSLALVITLVTLYIVNKRKSKLIKNEEIKEKTDENI